MFGNNALRRMAEYRMTKSTETDEELEKLLLPLMDQRDLNTDEFVGAFRAAAPAG